MAHRRRPVDKTNYPDLATTMSERGVLDKHKPNYVVVTHGPTHTMVFNDEAAAKAVAKQFSGDRPQNFANGAAQEPQAILRNQRWGFDVSENFAGYMKNTFTDRCVTAEEGQDVLGAANAGFNAPLSRVSNPPQGRSI